MTKFMTRTLAVATAVGALIGAPLAAQTSKVATINSPDAIFNVKALPTALQSIETKYAADLKTAGDRQTTLQAQLKPLYNALDTNRDGQLDQAEQQAAVQAQKPQIAQINAAQAAAQTEVGKTLRPYNLARIYVFDQLQKRYTASLDGLVASRQIGLVIPANDIIRQAPGTDLTATVRADVDKPLAIDPPATWKVTEEGVGLLQTYEQLLTEAAQRRAQQQQLQQAQGGAAPAAAAPATRAATPAGTPAVKRDRNGDPIKQ